MTLAAVFNLFFCHWQWYLRSGPGVLVLISNLTLPEYSGRFEVRLVPRANLVPIVLLVLLKRLGRSLRKRAPFPDRSGVCNQDRANGRSG
jgi:hypothetical protein